MQSLVLFLYVQSSSPATGADRPYHPFPSQAESHSRQCKVRPPPSVIVVAMGGEVVVKVLLVKHRDLLRGNRSASPVLFEK